MLNLKLFFTRGKIKKKINFLTKKTFEEEITDKSIKFSVNKNKIFVIIDLEDGNIDPIKFNDIIKQLKKDVFFKNIIISVTSQKQIKKQQHKKSPKIIAIASGKGGVGKSTIATNIAISLKRIGYKIGLIDADIYGPSIAHMMNLQKPPKTKDNFIIPVENYGIKCVSIGNMIPKDSSIPWRGPMIAKTLTQFIKKTKWANVDFIIIDLPPGTGDVQLTMSQDLQLDGVVIVSTPQKVAVIDAVRAADMFKKLKIPILGCIENMSFMKDGTEKKYLFGKDGVKNFCTEYNFNFLGKIEFDSKIIAAGDNGKPICEAQPSAKVSLDFGKIAESINI